MDVPRRRSDRNRASGRWSWRARAASTVGPDPSASDDRPTSTVTGPPPARARPAAASSLDGRSARFTPRLPHMVATAAGAAPGGTRMEWAACPLSPVVWGVSSMRVQPSWTTAWRNRRYRVPSSSLGSGPSSTMIPPGVQASSMVARGRPSTTWAGRPSANWASTWSVPITPLASRAHAYCASLVSRAPPRTATRSGSAAPSAVTHSSMASDHEARTDPVPLSCRRRGSPSRSSLP